MTIASDGSVHPATFWEKLFTPVTYYDAEYLTAGSNGYTNTVNSTPTNGAIQKDATQKVVDSLVSGVNNLSDIGTIVKVLFIGGLIFGTLVIVHEGKMALGYK